MHFHFNIETPDKKARRTYLRKFHRLYLGNGNYVMFANRRKALQFARETNTMLLNTVHQMTLIQVELFKIYRSTELHLQEVERVAGCFTSIEKSYYQLHRPKELLLIWRFIEHILGELCQVIELLNKHSDAIWLPILEKQCLELKQNLQSYGKDYMRIEMENGNPVLKNNEK